MAVRERLDRRTALSRRYTAMQSFTYNGRKYANGDPFPIDGMSWHNVQTLHGARHIDLVPIDQEPPAEGEDRGVTLTTKGGGNYEITAAWLADPVKVRGKDAAEAEAERIRTEGPPLGFIAGGSDVTVEDVGGGWYAINAPWLEMPVKVQGRDLAEQRQRDIHETGDPRPDPLKPGDVVLAGPDCGDVAGLRVVIDKIDGENAVVVGFNTADLSDGSLKTGTVPLASLTLVSKE